MHAVAAIAPLLTCVLFAGAIDRIRRQRPEAAHALSWSICFALIAAGWLVVWLVAQMPDRGGGSNAAAGLCWLAAAFFFVHGLRQRERRADRSQVLAAIWTANAFGSALLLDIAPPAMPTEPILLLLCAVGLLLAAVAIRPRVGRWNRLDLAAILLLTALALAKVAFVIAMIWSIGRTGSPPVFTTALIALLAMPCYVVLGVIAMLLLNEDLAAALHRLARTDALTGVWNRRGFDEAAAFLVARLPAQRPAAVAIADIDAFKAINDRYGHAAGDAALVRFAKLLARAVEPGDLLARLGGEEFVLLAIGADSDALFERLERVRGLMDLPTGDANEPGMTASFGVAQIGGEVRSLRDALERADRALYRAKREGRNRTILGEAPVGVLG